ncbi:TetR/AcrR family transcriptional regulator [Dysosmobacter sp.]|uniref:TetR/AcrR family transcriptional regulator n=1 Tax=Dysosmobacter sp. TaxID=2591382 RepID=UPI002A8A4F68|nr:TetR/AcrR family transcriptional regulator [Dysosmobacter sp.]MDY3281523.1 TetR/AcrR family transcriptional regulator [Dysosmobacter sp.]
MLKNTEDRRARRTRRLLKESLLELMQEKPFSQISVRDVTERADVNRTTFYLHYTDTARLLQSVEEDLLSDARTLIDAHLQETVAEHTLRPVFEPILDFTVAHRTVCTVLFENNEASQFTGHLQRLFQRSGGEIVQAWFRPRDDRQLSYLLEFVACGLIGLIAEWFRRGMDLPREELLDAAECLADGAAGRLLGRG